MAEAAGVAAAAAVVGLVAEVPADAQQADMFLVLEDVQRVRFDVKLSRNGLL